jgi:Tfp pilus assembly protein PilF
MSPQCVPPAIVVFVCLVAAGCRTPGELGAGGSGELSDGAWSKVTAETGRTAGKVVAPLASGWTAAKNKFSETWHQEEPNTNTDDVLSLANTPKAPSPKLLTAAGALALERGDLELARQQYAKALEIEPSYLPAHLSLARMHRANGQLPAAIEQYYRALQFHPKDPSVNNDLGLTLLESGQLEDAVARLQLAVRQDAQSTRYRNNLARALVRAGQDQQAVETLGELLGPANAHFNVACLLNESRQRHQAVAHLQHALAIDPQLAAARTMLVELDRLAAHTP